MLYDISHGASLSIAYIAWLKFHKEIAKERIRHLGMEIFNSEDIDETIFKFEHFFKIIGSPIRLTDIGIGESQKDKIYDLFVKNKVGGSNYQLRKEDYKTIIDLMINGE